MKPHPCPKCRRPLTPSGEVSVGRDTFPVYQCDDCVVRVDFMGEPVDVNYTFAVDGSGRAFDPADPNDAPSG